MRHRLGVSRDAETPSMQQGTPGIDDRKARTATDRVLQERSERRPIRIPFFDASGRRPFAIDVIQTVVCLPLCLARQRLTLDVLTQPPEPLSSQKERRTMLRKRYETGHK